MRHLRSALTLITGTLLASGCGARSTSGGYYGSDGAAAGGLPELGDCCTAHTASACPDLNVAACVCSQNIDCCSGPWTTECVSAAQDLGCTVCDTASGGGVGIGGNTPALGGGPQGGSAGGQFNSGGRFSTGGFGGAPSAGGRAQTGGTPNTESCCVPHEEPGCNDPKIEQCVCERDAWCCTPNSVADAWDATCARWADECGAGCFTGTGGNGSGGRGAGGNASGGGGNPGSCCFESSAPGCGEPRVEACVCKQDPYCCDQKWDSRCVVETEQCGSDCQGGGTSSGGASAAGGGASSSGGSGSTICEATVPEYCQDCYCGQCGQRFDACASDLGCVYIVNCISQSGCSGEDCLEPNTCLGVISAYPESLSKAIGFAACVSANQCSCP
jgi:hypothetical protein